MSKKHASHASHLLATQQWPTLQRGRLRLSVIAGQSYPEPRPSPQALEESQEGTAAFTTLGRGQALWGRWQGPSQSLIHPLLSGLTCWARPWAQAGPAEPPAFCQLGAVYTEGGFVEGVNKRLSLLGGDSIDIFKGIPFATASTLENPQRHPGWQGEGRRW